jgi:hypothetical protein
VFDTTNCHSLATILAPQAQPSAQYDLAVGLQGTWGTLLNRPGAVSTCTTLNRGAGFTLASSVLGGAVAARVVRANFSAWPPSSAESSQCGGIGLEWGEKLPRTPLHREWRPVVLADVQAIATRRPGQRTGPST